MTPDRAEERANQIAMGIRIDCDNDHPFELHVKRIAAALRREREEGIREAIDYAGDYFDSVYPTEVRFAERMEEFVLAKILDADGGREQP